MKAVLNLKLLFIGTLFACTHSLTIRDFSSKELYDVQPDHKDYCGVARYVVHKSEWAAIGTISTSKNISGFPMVNLKSVADSARDEPSTGNIYFYLTNLDFTGLDLLKSNKLTAMFSNDQDLECTKNGIDPMEPTCSRIIISGSVLKLDVNSEEFKFAKRSFISRHPAAVNWIGEHSFFLCKLDILQIIIIDWYGGANYVTVEDYYKANTSSNGFLDHRSSTVDKNSLNFDTHKSSSSDVVTKTKNDEKIRIEIKKGSDAVMIEL